MPTVSVVMPVFNASHLVSDALESILNQSFQDFEIIIYDDASTDDSVKTIEQYQDTRIKLLTASINSGAGYARSEALKHVHGDYIAFIDCDDIWFVDKLQRCVSFLDKHPNIAGVQSNYIVTEDKTIKKIVKPKQYIKYPDMMKKNHCAMSCMVVRAEIALGIKMPLIRARQDYAYWAKILQQNNVFATIDDTLVEYRKVKGSISSNPVKNVYSNYKMFRYELKFSALRSAFVVATNIIEKIRN